MLLSWNSLYWPFYVIIVLYFHTNYSSNSFTSCCGLNMFVSPQIHVWNLMSIVIVLGAGVLGRWFVMKAEPIWMGLDLYDRGLWPLPCPLHHVRLQCKDSRQGSGLSPDTKSAGNMTLDFPVSGIVKNTFLLFIRHPILLQQPELRYLDLAFSYGNFSKVNLIL